MSKFPKKAAVKLAIPKNTYEHDMSNVHISTTDYFKLGVNFCMPAPPKNTFKNSIKSFTRLMPMAVPSFASAQIHQRMYFVPFSRIQKSYNDMIEKKAHQYDDTLQFVDGFRTMKMSDIVSFFLQTSQSTVTTSNSYDFSNAVGTKYNFTYTGRTLYNIMCELGIKPELNMDTKVSAKDTEVNIMPFLALLRIMVDYYYPSQYETQSIKFVEKVLNENTSSLEKLDSTSFGFCANMLTQMLTYNNDYFVGAYDLPTGNNMGSSNQFGYNFQIDDTSIDSNIAHSKVVVAPGAGDTPYIKESSTSTANVVNFTQYIDTALKRATQMIERSRIVGSRIVDRFLARFGIKLDDVELNRCAYIGEYSVNIMYGDVISTSDTSGAALGDFAGKGIGYGESDMFNYFNKEAGIYIGLNFAIPKIGYYQGISRFALCTKAFDFYTPEFDNLGVDAIAQAEVYMPYKNITNVDTSDLTKKIFGYQPRYAWMKQKLDSVSGDFLFDSINTGLNAWHLMREIDPNNHISGTSPNLELDIVHSLGFVFATDNEQYDRNFATTMRSNDNFILVNQFNCKCYNTMKPIYESYVFDDLDNKEMLFNVNGKNN